MKWMKVIEGGSAREEREDRERGFREAVAQADYFYAQTAARSFFQVARFTERARSNQRKHYHLTFHTLQLVGLPGAAFFGVLLAQIPYQLAKATGRSEGPRVGCMMGCS